MSQLKIIKGNVENIAVTFNGADGNPIDLTNTIVFFTVKKWDLVKKNDPNDDLAVIKKTVSAHTNPTAGETAIILDGTETDIEAGEYSYDLKVKTSTEDFMYIEKQKLIIELGVTQRLS